MRTNRIRNILDTVWAHGFSIAEIREKAPQLNAISDYELVGQLDRRDCEFQLWCDQYHDTADR